MSIEELKQHSDRLHGLMADPQPGLMTWNQMLSQVLLALVCDALPCGGAPDSKASLIPKPHSKIMGAIVVEVWYRGTLIGTINGADGPGIRFMSKHQLLANLQPGLINVAEVVTPAAPAIERN